MVVSESSPCIKKSGINLRLLPIKLHFFFAYGAIAGVVPFLPIFAQDLGISATAVGIVYTISPFVVMFAKPIFGMIADYFQNLKLVIIVIMLISSAAFFSILFIPPLKQQNNSTDANFNTSCQNIIVAPQNGSLSSCLSNLKLCLSDCVFNFNNCSIFNETQNILSACSNNTSSLNIKIILEEIKLNQNMKGNLSSCNCNDFVTCFNTWNSCIFSNNELSTKSIYESSQFWIFALLAIIAGSSSASIFSLSDAACYEVIDDPYIYGKQRLWATISWGLVTLLTGYLNDNAVFFKMGNYAPGFYLMLILMLVDIIILMKVTLREVNSSRTIWKEVIRIFTFHETAVFAAGVYIIGGLTALLWQYQFWFLKDLGANQFLLGLNVAIQCLLAEVPFFFLSGKIIARFGHMNCLITSFAAFALRYGLYFFLINPWLVLPIEILHGQTYGVFYATMTSYANSKAPAGTEATMMGVLGGLFEGLGVATGSLIGGVGVDKLGARYMYLTAAIFSAICFVVFTIIQFIFKSGLLEELSGIKKLSRCHRFTSVKDHLIATSRIFIK